MIDLRAFGRRLRLCRDQRRETQKQVETATGIRQSKVAQFEGGRARPSIGSLIRFADHYNVSTDWLLGRSAINNWRPDMTVFTTDARIFFATLDGEGREIVDGLIAEVEGALDAQETLHAEIATLKRRLAERASVVNVAKTIIDAADPARRAANLWAFSLAGLGVAVAAHLDAPPVQLRVDHGAITMAPLTTFNAGRLVARFGPPILVDPDGPYPAGNDRRDRYPHGRP